MPPVSLHDLVGQLQAVDPSQILLVDRQTGEVSISAAGDTSQPSCHFEPFHGPTADDEREFARRFCELVSDAKDRERLRLALSSTSPMEAFESALYRCRIAHEWFPFRGEQLVEFARGQLDARGVPYADDLPGLGANEK
jgi:hypothetical protein